MKTRSCRNNLTLNIKNKRYELNKKNRVSIVNKIKLKKTNSSGINSFKDLIKLSNSIQIYDNLDTVMLWKIRPYIKKLDQMIGLQSLKDSLLYQILYYLKGFHKLNKDSEYLHTMIMGPPGHGKTEVARIIGNIYKSMNILSENGHFKVAYRDDFISGYLGQTAIKTRQLLESCIGGILFVDEVYSLGPGVDDKDSFSKECIETITAFLSEHKNDFCFIGAGYEKDIKKCFFASNKGLERRFQWNHKIDTYSPENLTQIFIKMVKDINWVHTVSEKDITNLIKNNKDLFKNAGGDIEIFISKCKLVHAKRVFSLNDNNMFVLISDDLKKAIKLMKKLRLDTYKENASILSMYM